MSNRSKKVNANLKRNGRMLGGYVPEGLLDRIEEWIRRAPKRDKSTFLREAVRKKLRDDGVEFSDPVEAGR